VPNIDYYDTNESFCLADIMKIKRWGFNVVRLGVMWAGVMPNENQVNYTYLQQIEQIINMLGEQDIRTIVDVHQDDLNEHFCGQGMPDYLLKYIPSSKAFPQPVKKSIGVDTNGVPLGEECKKTMFALYYFTEAVGTAFDALYTPGNRLHDDFLKFWDVVSHKFANNSNILGYELINEPFFGNIAGDYKKIIPKNSERKYLQPFYDEISNIIRKNDKTRVLFFEPVPFEVGNTALEHGPGGSGQTNLQAYSYHVYCPFMNSKGTISMPKFCQFVDRVQYQSKIKDLKSLGTAGMLTEFGCVNEEDSSLSDLKYMCSLADSYMQGFVYWNYKPYHDITTYNFEAEGLYYPDGLLMAKKVKALSRTYPQQIAGVPISYNFNDETNEFTLLYKVTSTLQKNTKLYINREMRYQKGANIVVNSTNIDIISSNTSNIVNLQHRQIVIGEWVHVKVTSNS
jgi:endoglycosylceramidase